MKVALKMLVVDGGVTPSSVVCQITFYTNVLLYLPWIVQAICNKIKVSYIACPLECKLYHDCD